VESTSYTTERLKTLNTMSLEELVGTLNVHKQELQQDGWVKKGKYSELSAQKPKKIPLSNESSSRSMSKCSSKALSMENFSDGESGEDDELAFILRNICKMWKNKNESRWKNSSKKVFKEREDREKSSIICYECKKPRFFKFECP